MASAHNVSSHAVEVDRLYQLPLDQFTAARNELAKQVGRGDAPAVRALAKPNVLAWALNQLYWSKRETFDRLVAAAARLRGAQAQALMGKPSDMRSAGDQHREALRVALKEATGILEAAGHGVTPDAIRELTGALEALPWSEPAGRLTRPPAASGFGALAGLEVRATPSARVGQSSSVAKQHPPSRVGQSSSFAEHPPKSGLGQSAGETRVAPSSGKAGVGRTSSDADRRRQHQAALKSARAAAAAAHREEAGAAARLKKAEAQLEAARQRERAAREAAAAAERGRAAAEEQAAAAARTLDAARKTAASAARDVEALERG